MQFILTNAGGCWYIRIQFKRRVFKSPAVQTSIFYIDSVPLFWIFDDIPQWYTIWNNIDKIAGIAVTWNKNIYCPLFTD